MSWRFNTVIFLGENISLIGKYAYLKNMIHFARGTNGKKVSNQILLYFFPGPAWSATFVRTIAFTCCFPGNYKEYSSQQLKRYSVRSNFKNVQIDFKHCRLPTYFHDNFPEAKSWIFNIVPWILMIPGTIAGGYLSQRLLAKGYSVGSTRKILESICMGTEMICLVVIGMKLVHFSS